MAEATWADLVEAAVRHLEHSHRMGDKARLDWVALVLNFNLLTDNLKDEAVHGLHQAFGKKLLLLGAIKVRQFSTLHLFFERLHSLVSLLEDRLQVGAEEIWVAQDFIDVAVYHRELITCDVILGSRWATGTAVLARMLRMILQMLIQGNLVFTLEFNRPIWINQPNDLRYIHKLLSNDFNKFFLLLFTD